MSLNALEDGRLPCAREVVLRFAVHGVWSHCGSHLWVCRVDWIMAVICASVELMSILCCMFALLECGWVCSENAVGHIPGSRTGGFKPG